MKDCTNLMVIQNTLDENTTFKTSDLHFKVQPLNQNSGIIDRIQSQISTLFFSFLGEHHLFLKDFTNLMVIKDTLDENTTLSLMGCI